MFINEDIHPQIREWYYNQMMLWLRCVLNTTNLDGDVDQSFDEMLEQMYLVLPQHVTAPACNCLWDVLFNKLGYGSYNYKYILIAYKAKYKFTTKDQIYHHMINELDAWIDTVNDRNDIITIALGMTINMNIFDVFYKFNGYRHDYSKSSNVYDNLLDTLHQINFDATNLSIDYWYYIEGICFSRNVQPYIPYVQRVYDLQSVYSSHITALCQYSIHNMEYYKDSDNVVFKPITIQDCIELLANNAFDPFNSRLQRTQHYLKQYGLINNITDKWQILDHIKAAIGPYPTKLEPVLELCRTHRFKFYCMCSNYYEYYTIMNELIDSVPITFTLIKVQYMNIKDIPAYCAKVSKTYRRIKAAKHEDDY